MLSAVHGKILIAVGVASDLHRPRDPLPAPGIDTPAESPLAIRGGPALQRQDRAHGQEQPQCSWRQKSLEPQ